MVRACGSRKDNSLYAVVETSPEGLPIPCFLFDPPLRWSGPKTLRAPMVIEDRTGTRHAVMSIGMAHYPFVPDFVVEAADQGVSKRLPRDWDPSGLIPGKSKLLLVHPRALPEFQFEADHTCPKRACPGEKDPQHEKGDRNCIGALWPLSVWSEGEVHQTEVHDDRFTATTPSVRFESRVPAVDGKTVEPLDRTNKVGRVPRELEWTPGVVLAFPRWKFDWVSKKRVVPREVKERVEKAGFVLDIVPE